MVCINIQVKRACNVLHASVVKRLLLKAEGSVHSTCAYGAEQYVAIPAANPTKKLQSGYCLSETPHIVCLRTLSAPVATDLCLPSLPLFEE